MKRHNITLIVLALLMMNFQCDLEDRLPLSIVNLSLTKTCDEDQVEFNATLYLSSQQGFLPVEEKTTNIGTSAVFQYTSYSKGYVKLEPLNASTCRSSWHQIESGKRQSISLPYLSEQPIQVNLTSRPSVNATSISLEIYRMIDNTILRGDDDEQLITDLSSGNFPLTDIILSTSSSYRFLLYEQMGQTRNILSDTRVTTDSGGTVMEVAI